MDELFVEMECIIFMNWEFKIINDTIKIKQCLCITGHTYIHIAIDDPWNHWIYI